MGNQGKAMKGVLIGMVSALAAAIEPQAGAALLGLFTLLGLVSK